MRISMLVLLAALCIANSSAAQAQESVKPRIIISTDIGGTDPDDFQSMIHFLMYSDMFDTEGLISSPSFGDGRAQDILNMIDLYEKDLPKLRKHSSQFPSPESLRAVTKQGRHGQAPMAGYATPTEGSEWIVRCARKSSDRPLWVLVWGGLEDVAQALHDTPDIAPNIKVYWIGGPNKKWGAKSYAYIAENFPNLWIIESNATYRGFFPNEGVPDSLSNDRYYDRYIKAAGHMGKDFKNHYDGRVKMGDSPSLFYLMHGNPLDPTGESWGGSYEKMKHSSRRIFDRPATLTDTVPNYSVIEFHIKGPVVDLPINSPCCTLTIARQKWKGYYAGGDLYVVRYAFKESETLSYIIESDIPGFPSQRGEIVVENIWPGRRATTDFSVGSHWYTDKSAPDLFCAKWQGAATVTKWRSNILLDWAERWKWLQE